MSFFLSLCVLPFFLFSLPFSFSNVEKASTYCYANAVFLPTDVDVCRVWIGLNKLDKYTKHNFFLAFLCLLWKQTFGFCSRTFRWRWSIDNCQKIMICAESISIHYPALTEIFVRKINKKRRENRLLLVKFQKKIHSSVYWFDFLYSITSYDDRRYTNQRFRLWLFIRRSRHRIQYECKKNRFQFTIH